MKREEFKQVVKAFSFWRIDKRKGNYRLPSGARLSFYLEELTSDLCNNNKIAFAKNGNVYAVLKQGNDDIIFIPFAEDENFNNAEQEKRIKSFAWELLI
jgi:hypothetical protein